jgi:outer membrane usher protein
MRLGLVVPDGLDPTLQLIPLSALHGIRVRIDDAQQIIYIDAEIEAMRTVHIDPGSTVELAPLASSSYGALLNYDVLSSISHASLMVSGLLNARAFGPFGSLETSWNVSLAAPGKQYRGTRRLGSTYTYSDQDRLLRVRGGDIVSGALAWSRAIRLGGIQISSDFNLRPDLVTYPLPSIASSTVVPATVSLIANGLQQSSTAIQPGPFSVQMLPVVTGAGQVSLAIQDELGRQKIVSLPFYASSELLKPGLTSYSLEAGSIREGFGTDADRYVKWAGSGAVRRGMTDWLTLEAHAETTQGLGQAGIGATIRVGALGIANFAMSDSYTRPVIGGQQRGGFASIGFQRVARHLSVSISATLASHGYRDIAAIRGVALPRSTVQASASYQMRQWGLLGVSYISRSSFENSDGSSADRNRIRLVNASYAINVAANGSLRLSAYKSLIRRGAFGVSCGLTFSFGHRGIAASLYSSLADGKSTQTATLTKNALEPGDLGYTIQDTEGAGARRNVQLEYFGPWSRIGGGVEQFSGGTRGQLAVRGALSWIGGAVFASDHIDDSFAVVRTAQIAKIPVQYENRAIGTTNSKGLILVPSLLSYQNNRLSLDPSRLPPDVVVGQTFMIVRPRDGAGTIIDFDIKVVRGAVVILHDLNDKAVPLGSIVEMHGAPAQVVGYDGEVYLQNLKTEILLTVTRPDQSVCAAKASYNPVVGDIPRIGPVTCQ